MYGSIEKDRLQALCVSLNPLNNENHVHKLCYFKVKYEVQYNFIITLSLGSIEIDSVISETVL